MADESDKVLAVVESGIFYHAEPESRTSKSAGSMELGRIGTRDSHKILSVFLRYVKNSVKVVTTRSGRAVQVRYFS